MGNVDPPSRASIAAQRLRDPKSGKSTLLASQRPKNTKSHYTRALKKYVEPPSQILTSFHLANECVGTRFPILQWIPQKLSTEGNEYSW